jgi:hypothetical protein
MQSFTDFDILMAGQTRNLTIFVRDPRNDVLVDVQASSDFSLMDMDNNAVVTQTFGPEGTGVVTRSSKGTYHFNMNTSTYSDEYVAMWRCVLEQEVIDINSYVKSVSAKYYKYAAALRNQIDKSQKSIVDYIENIDRQSVEEPAIRFFYGYDDRHLFFYLERGVQYLNAIPPYTALTVDDFPFDTYGTLLVDAATIAALEAQGLFAVDTDYNYALGGNSMVVEHFGKLNTYLASLLARFDKLSVSFKQQYRSSGTVLYQFLPGGVRAARQLQAMPSGWWSRLLSGMGG